MMLGVMVLSFTLLSAAFMLLSYRYIISEKRESMERNADYIAPFTASYYQQYLDIRSELYKIYGGSSTPPTGPASPPTARTSPSPAAWSSPFWNRGPTPA